MATLAFERHQADPIFYADDFVGLVVHLQHPKNVCDTQHHHGRAQGKAGNFTGQKRRRRVGAGVRIMASSQVARGRCFVALDVSKPLILLNGHRHRVDVLVQAYRGFENGFGGLFRRVLGQVVCLVLGWGHWQWLQRTGVAALWTACRRAGELRA